LEIGKATVRRLTIEKQGFGSLPNRVTKEGVFATVDRLGCVQIDTINVVERAHYLTLWSRLGPYEKELLHEVVYGDRLLFEHWAHAASYIPFKDYRYFLRPMESRRENMEERFRKRAGGDPRLLELVLERVRREGPLASKDFEHKRRRPSKGWWDWKPAKVALETLFGAGVLLVSHRKNFQRYYDLAERVLPGWVDVSAPMDEDRVRFFALRTMDCLGLVEPQDIRGYYQNWCVNLGMTSRQLKAFLDDLTGRGEAVRFKVEGEKTPHYCLPEDCGRIEEVEAGDFGFSSVRLLTNFDNLLWLRDRVKADFGFKAKLETYIPRDKRKYGYYNMPILYGDRLVGRIVPKMDRGRGVLVINSVWHEPWFEPDEEFEDGFAETLDGFARFHGADDVEMRESQPRKG